MNCDSLVDFADINPFVLALSNPTAYGNTFPDCDILNGDINCNGQFGFDDINPFVACLTEGACPHYETCAFCGDGVVDPGEDCDGTNLSEQTCQTLGYDSGDLTCNPDCTFNFQECFGGPGQECGDGVIEPELGEQCDDENLDNGDGCSASCLIEDGWWCGAEPSYCRQNQWTPPIGIPRPDFGIEEKHWMYEGQFYEAGGFDYKDAGNGPYTHYIDNSVSCTDTNNPFGTAANPRCTIPTNLQPGSVVEVYGGPYTMGPWGFIWINGQGTAEKPIFIRGINHPRFSVSLNVYTSDNTNKRYIILENLNLYRWEVLAPADHIALRNCEVHGDSNGGGAYATSNDYSYANEHIVFYNNTIHDNGDWLLGTPGHTCCGSTGYTEPGGEPCTVPPYPQCDQDIRGIGISTLCSYVWVVDNEISHCSGDGLQINAGNNIIYMPTTNHIYVGRNLAYENKQAGLWTKQAVDVIFSQNTVYNHKPIGEHPSASGAGMGFQYGPERVWFLFNHIYNCSYGIHTASTSGLGYGTDSYFIGNVIHDIHHDPNYPYTPETAWSNAGMALVSVQNRYIIGNTIYNADAGINEVGNGSFYMKNNIVGNITEPEGEHVCLENGDAASQSILDNNLFYQDGELIRIRWGSAHVYDLSEFQSSIGKCLNCMNTNPLFADLNQNDFHLQAESPAVDRGVLEEVYQTFYELYGIDISVDFDGKTRPKDGNGISDSEWDIGAFEYSLPTSCIGLANGVFCDDEQFCTFGETCQSQECQGGSNYDCSYLNDDCNVGQCNEQANQCTTIPINNGGDCNSDNLCFTPGTCNNGNCEGSNILVDCNDAIDCTLDSCVPATGECSFTPNNNLCSDDGIACTIESCITGQGCVSEPSDGLCQPGYTCVQNEGCVFSCGNYDSVFIPASGVNYVVIEAEHYCNLLNSPDDDGDSWQIVNNLAGSVGLAVHALPDDGGDSLSYQTSSKITFRFRPSATGTYYLSTRLSAPSASGDSLLIGLDSNYKGYYNDLGATGGFVWLNAGNRINLGTLEANTLYEVDLTKREDGHAIDRIFIGLQGESFPSGTMNGPAESPIE